jgi:hypothetical protein
MKPWGAENYVRILRRLIDVVGAGTAARVFGQG